LKIFTFNGIKAAYNAFAAVCIVTLIYFGFLNNNTAVAVSGEAVKTTYLAIIIDDFGNGSDGTKEFMYMDIPFTGAVMPGCPNSGEEARQLLANGKEVIVHIPMEPNKGSKSWLPQGAVMADFTPDEARSAAQAAIEQIPGATGINNHMGSKVMENKELVLEILTMAKENNLYFVDSLTTGKSKAAEAAKEIGMQIYLRDVFLDSTKDISKIEKNIKKAGEVAVKENYCIAIGHVGAAGGKVTAQAIKNMLPSLSEKGVKLVTMSELISIMENNSK